MPNMSNKKINSTGKVVSIIGPVVDVHFNNYRPVIYEALKLKDLILEVEQQLADGLVRCLALGPTEGLTRNTSVTATGKSVSVPTGPKTLGRMFNVLGQPIDGGKPIKTTNLTPIHQPAPDLTEQEKEISNGNIK